MFALTEAIRNNLKDVGLVCATFAGITVVCGLVVKFIKRRLADAAGWIDTVLTIKLKPIQKALDNNIILHNGILGILEEIHRGTAELLPNGGTHLHDKITDMHRYIESLKDPNV